MHFLARFLVVPALIASGVFLLWGAGTAPSRSSWSHIKPARVESDFMLATARLELAKEGTFGLVIDLEEGRMQLLFGGTTLRELQIPEGLGPHSPHGLDTARLISRTGTLPFEPVQRVQAPADTSVAEAPTIRPLDSHPAYGVLTLDNGMEIRLLPSDLSLGETLSVSLFRTGAWLARALDVTADLVRFRSAPDRPVLTIPMSDVDARALFRALPIEAPVYIRYPAS